MKKKVDRVLQFMKSVNSTEFAYMRNLIQLADFIRGVQRKYFINDDTMAKKMKVTKQKFALMKNGAYNFSVTDMAKIESIANDEASNSVEIKIPLDAKQYGYNAVMTKATSTSDGKNVGGK